MKRVLMAALVAGTMGVSARAATTTTSEFVAIVGPTLEFVEASGRLALAEGGAPRLRAFATSEVESRQDALDDLATWRQADVAQETRDSLAPTLDHLGPVAGLVRVPYDAVATVADAASPPFTGLPSADRLRARSRADLDRLAALRGADFAGLYLTLQVDALERLEATYKSFILNGDEPALRRLAIHDLPRVEGLLRRARRL